MSNVRLPSPALVIACVALAVALGGTALAATPVAKRALFADNAGKLQGKTLAQISTQVSARLSRTATAAAGQPGPASTAAGLVDVKSVSGGQLAANSYRVMAVSCDGGAKIMGAGFSSDGGIYNYDSYPSSDTTWSLGLFNADENGTHSVTLYATCLK